ncbi:Holliday junction resolvase RuvX [Croceivirga radicis]|uniref:Putative pre-16S rRNA nuclease n=1 Tax=Croceivirga radicis TaxID=1929488 RepID=A0A1V6LQD9_9FLAO|nr:Holliday junction resolvase RuvX [Croceivirga radicis]OQD42401.1 Holliday junction resolvase RuvX [Croceivirga radicis]
MARLMALDYGKVRTGIAVTDEIQLIASGLTTVATKDLIPFLKNYFAQENVEKVIVGEPKQMDGSASESEKLIKAFLAKFQQNFPNLSVERQDERFTSKLAVRTMIDGGLKKKKRQDKALVDQISATLILQSYLERK